MAKDKIINPLYESQREKSGSTTFSKYSYQYHWALYRVIEEHALGNEYALFMEVHEDVVIADSLDESKALFEFNQIKTNKDCFTAKSLIKLKNGSSVLGKLLNNCNGKSFSNKLSNINLVSVNGFSLAIEKEDVDLEKIGVSDLHIDTIKDLADAIKAEISLDPLPKNLHFIIPKLKDENFQDLIIAEISKLINLLSPDAYYDSVAIYRVLHDDITRKGMITYDIKDWNTFINDKSLTSNTVTRVINQFSNLKDEALIQAKFSSIVNELGLNTIKSKSLEKSFNRYRQNRIKNRSTLQMDTTAAISKLLMEAEVENIDEWENLFNYVIEKLSEKIKGQFKTENEVKSAIIYEFIIQE